MMPSLISPAAHPTHWSFKRLRYLATINREQLPGDTPPDRSLRYVDISTVGSDGLLQKPQVMLFENAPSRARRLAREGDTAISTVRTYLKAIAFVDRGHSDCVWSTGFALVSPGSEFDPRFLYYVTRSKPFLAELERRSVGVSYPAVTMDDVADIVCPVPPQDEQRRIADFLDREVAKLDKANRLKKSLAGRLPERLGAAMHVAIAGLPRNAKLGYVCSWLSGGTPPKEEPEHWAGPVPWASTKDLATDDLHDTVDHVTEEAAESYSRVAPGGSVLVATRGMALAKRLPLAVSRRPVAFNQDLKALVPATGIHADYLRIVLRGYQSELLASVVESAHGTRRLETRHLKALRIPIPKPAIQRRIIDEVHEIETEIQATAATLHRQLDLLEERRETLITAAVAGQLDPSSHHAPAVAA